MNDKAVIGLGFGDEGKGLVTNYLSLLNPYAAVVRYSGGQQAGHTVVKGEVRHIFSNFGSGTLNGAPTYWSEFCTVDPVGLYNELKVLQEKGIEPKLYINKKCPVTTPMDKKVNRIQDEANGTCGVGVGTTKQREEDHYSLLFEDLFHPTILNIKLRLIQNYYQDFCSLEAFHTYLDAIRNQTGIFIFDELPYIDSRIFEGSQGLLLDQDYGFFPHVTRSHVGTPNILDLGSSPECYAVTRAYQTRHGNGPITNTYIPHQIKANPLETNVYNQWQGEFRTSILDLDLLEYAVSKDYYLNRNRHTLVITCIDHVTDDLRMTINGQQYQADNEEAFISMIAQTLKFDHVLTSRSDKSELITKFY
jgi:adenylosuccinate synthase